MEHWQYVQIVEGTLVYKSLVDLTEVDMALAANLDRSKLITKVILLRGGDEVPKIIDTEAGCYILLFPFLRQGIEVVKVR